MTFVKILLLPFSLLYGIGVFTRSYLYRAGIFSRTEFDIPIICVGNLSVGGTGKTPMIEYLVRLTDGKFHPATLSRGYGRKTMGYLFANDGSTALEAGDEPCQFKKKFPHLPVAVCNNRELGIPNLLADAPDTDVVLLDDAFQHLPVKAGLNVLLTDFSKLFYKDFLLPSGRLREFRSGYERADVIVVTKCPNEISDKRKSKIIAGIKPLVHQQVYFSTLRYGDLYAWQDSRKNLPLSKDKDVVAISGIANADSFFDYLEQRANSVCHLRYGDHHRFGIADLEKLKFVFEQVSSGSKIIVTTEKDAMRLAEYKDWIEKNDLPVYCLPVQMQFFDGEGKFFDEYILNFLRTNGKPD